MRTAFPFVAAPRLPRPLSLALATGALALATACTAPSGGEAGVDETESELRTSYGNLLETLDGPDLDRWIAARAAVVAGFDQICGDTICSGDFSNLATVRLTCSSTSAAKKLKDCTWVLGGSIDYVDARTGKLTSDARVFTCKIPVAGNARAMLDVLAAAGDRALQAPLPGTGRSFYDGLVDCFDGVTGGPPPPEPAKTFYVELADHQWNASSEAGLAWNATKQSLARAFDDECGDTFCEGEYPDVTPLRLACAVNLNTSRVSRCSWTFAMADASVDRTGKVVATTTTRRCNVEVGATVAAFTAALAGDDPLHAPLPGKTTSIHDALIGCL